MGWPASAVNDATLWEFTAAVAGWNEAHNPETEPPPMTPTEFEAMKLDEAEFISENAGHG